MSNEEHIEEMYYNAHKSGVIKMFRKKISDKLINSDKLKLIDIIEEVYNEMERSNQITETGPMNY